MYLSVGATKKKQPMNLFVGIREMLEVSPQMPSTSPCPPPDKKIQHNPLFLHLIPLYLSPQSYLFSSPVVFCSLKNLPSYENTEFLPKN